MKTAFLLASILIPAVLCTEPFARNDLKTMRDEIIKALHIHDYINCVDQMSKPLLAMITADEATYNTTCGSPPYFTQCETKFTEHCEYAGCNIAVMLAWVSSFSTAAHNYTCKSVSFNYINEIWENGGARCILRVKTPLQVAIYKLYNSIWNDHSVNCSSSVAGEPIKNMGYIVETLGTCSDKLRDLAINYFNEVISESPCKGTFHFSAGVRSADNVGLAVVSMVIAYIATTFH